MAGRRGYNDIPDEDGIGYDDELGDPNNGGCCAGTGDNNTNPFAATNGGNNNSKSSIRAGGARPSTSGLDDSLGYDDNDDFGDDYDYSDDDYDYEQPRPSSASRGRRGGRGGRRSSSSPAGHQRMQVQTLSTIRGGESSSIGANMAKCWLYCGLVMLAVMGMLMGVLKESRIAKHQAATAAAGAGAGMEGYVRPHDYNDDDDDEGGGDDDYDGLFPSIGGTAQQQNKGRNKDEPQPADETAAASSTPANTDVKHNSKTTPTASNGVPPVKKKPHHRDPTASFRSHDPFHLTDASWYGSVFAPPPFPAAVDGHVDGHNGHGNDGNDEYEGRGYFQYPSIHNSTLVFCSEGDLYLTRLPDFVASGFGGSVDGSVDGSSSGSSSSSKDPIPPIPSVKLTTTVGNVLTPHINPVYPYLVAYTATYTGTREAYLLDLRPSPRGLGPAGPALRLTYFDGIYGVERVVGWDDDGTSLIVATMHDEVAMEDMRLYKIGIVQGRKQSSGASKGDGGGGNARWIKSRQGSPLTVSSVEPIPLHQAIDGAPHKSADEDSSCLFFTRFKQSSSTFRYVGGTAEHLWAWCEGEGRAVALTGDYKGTSKSPGIYRIGTENDGDATYYLLFISDRHDAGGGNWSLGTLNLWAVPLPTQDELYSGTDSSDADGEAGQMPKKMPRPFQLTSVNCDYNGMSLMEYAVDEVTGNLILRIGADLHLMEKDKLVELLEKGSRRLDDEGEDDGDEDEEDDAVAAVKEEEDDTDTTAKVAEGAKKVGGKTKKGKKKRNKGGAGEAAASSTSPVPETRDGDDDSPSVSSEAIPKAGIGSTSLAAPALPISILSDLQNLHERLLPVTHPTFINLLDTIDAYKTPYGTLSALVTVRGQTWINPVIPDLESFYKYEGGGMNMPPRRYRVAPGSTTGGMTRIMLAVHVPQPEKNTRTSLILATDPLSPTAELAFYLVETLADDTPSFAEVSDLPRPILGGHINGGSVKTGGLGSIKDNSVSVSPCGRRVAWTDTDGRICAMALPNLGDYWASNATNLETTAPLEYVVLPQENENGQPMIGINADLTWSPGGRYLAIEHSARNQFSIISIADLGKIASPDVSKNLTDVNDDDNDNDDEKKSENWDINVGRIVQATPDRFNSVMAFWGRTTFDMAVEDAAGTEGSNKVLPTATTLYYLTDRDVVLSGVSSPWGTRAPSPHFEKNKCVYALPLVIDEDEIDDDEEVDNAQLVKKLFAGPYSGGGASELSMLREAALKEIEAAKEEAGKDADNSTTDGAVESKGPDNRRREKAKTKATVTSQPTVAPTKALNSTDDREEMPGQAAEGVLESLFPVDVDISFGPKDDQSLSFARRVYRVSNIPKASYLGFVSQLKDDAALILLEEGTSGGAPIVKIFSIDDFPSDGVDPMPVELKVPGMDVAAAGLSTSRQHLYFIYKMPGKVRTKIVANDAASLVSLLIKDDMFTKNIVDNVDWALSIWPSLEYQQMFADAWRLLRDYFYDAGMTNIDWKGVYDRYLPLVERCSKREEVDDVLRQMASELSALHVFVYGGEYNLPLHEDIFLEEANEVASLGATVRRSVEWAGYVVQSVPERDPDFALMDGRAVYSPLSDDVLRMSGQRGLDVGDVIIGVNGESVMNVPSMHMLLRGLAGKSVRLEVLRVKSGQSPLLSRRRRARATRRAGEDNDNDDDDAAIIPEPLIVVPLAPPEAANLRYTAWEWKTRQAVKELSTEAGFTAGYVHLRDMSGSKAEDAFVRGFYPDYDKQALIVDVRHNHGGNIDSWLLDVLQRRAWMYWQGRTTNITNGGLGWDEQFAFRGHVVVLIDEKTSSDGEGFSRGVSELGLGKLVGTRTWGGGIWLSSDNKLVDGGIATAPEIGTYNKNFGWGLGIENMGVEPDVWVDNDPHETYGGRDAQLEKAISVLKDWLEEEPVVLPESPGRHRDMSIREEAKGCAAR